jgi:hypothetical protein
VTNPNGFRGRYTIQTTVVGQIGMAELDDGSIWIVYLACASGVRLDSWPEPFMVRPPNKIL